MYQLYFMVSSCSVCDIFSVAKVIKKSTSIAKCGYFIG